MPAWLQEESAWTITHLARARLLDGVSEGRHGRTRPKPRTRSAHPVRSVTSCAGRSPGLQLDRGRRLPGNLQWRNGGRSLLHSCGGSSGFAVGAPLTGFPLRRVTRTVAPPYVGGTTITLSTYSVRGSELDPNTAVSRAARGVIPEHLLVVLVERVLD